MKDVFCTHHVKYGQCTQEDWDDAITGRCPAGTVRVVFDSFTQAIPITYLVDKDTWEKDEEPEEDPDKYAMAR